MEKHSTEWCRQNPGQASGDLYRFHMAIQEARRLIEIGDAASRDEALTWLRNAEKF